MSKTIGKVTATENKPTTCNTVRFWVQKDQIIRPFDIVRVNHISRNGGKSSQTYAMVQDLQYLTDSAGHLANYVSSDFGDLEASPQNERLGTTIAEADVLYNNEEIEMPVRDGASVEWADAEGIKEALGLKGFKNPIPGGYIRVSNGEEIPVEFEASFLVGPEGAHLNIAGISGLATKTSYAMFLLNSVQQKMSDSVTTIIFNVKGRDLLAIDEENSDLTQRQREEWRKCGLKDKPFDNVTYLYPYANRPRDGYTSSHVDKDKLQQQKKAGKAFNYFYDVEIGKVRLPLLFSDIDDPTSSMESIAQELRDKDFSSWDDLREYVKKERTPTGSKTGDINVMSWRKFSRLLRTRTESGLFSEKCDTDSENRKQRSIHDAIAGLRAGHVLVIDIEPLPDYLQCLVFGDVVQTIYGAKLGEDDDINAEALGTVLLFADELNKYAPKTSSGRTLTQNLLEISERGRSLGLVLFGAEQFRSGVHDRVLGNCGTNAFGRTSAVEITNCKDYKFLPDSYKAALVRLPQGELLLQHAVFKTSVIKVRFPYPSYYQPRGR
jgi:DNA helicase HerA-like ATPase